MPTLAFFGVVVDTLGRNGVLRTEPSPDRARWRIVGVVARAGHNWVSDDRRRDTELVVLDELGVFGIETAVVRGRAGAGVGVDVGIVGLQCVRGLSVKVGLANQPRLACGQLVCIELGIKKREKEERAQSQPS